MLQYSHAHQALTVWSDNVRILEKSAEQGLMSAQESLQLIDAYTCLRDETHHRNLLNLDADVDDTRFIEQRECVVAQWQRWLG